MADPKLNGISYELSPKPLRIKSITLEKEPIPLKVEKIAIKYSEPQVRLRGIRLEVPFKESSEVSKVNLEVNTDTTVGYIYESEIFNQILQRNQQSGLYSYGLNITEDSSNLKMAIWFTGGGSVSTAFDYIDGITIYIESSNPAVLTTIPAIMSSDSRGVFYAQIDNSILSINTPYTLAFDGHKGEDTYSFQHSFVKVGESAPIP